MSLPTTSDPQFDEVARIGNEALDLSQRFLNERNAARAEAAQLRTRVAELTGELAHAKMRLMVAGLA